MVAGLFGGLSILCKSTGLLYVAAVLLYLVYRDQSLTAERRRPGSSWGYGLFSAVCLMAFLGVLVRLAAIRSTFMDALHFVVPGAVLVGLLLFREWTLRGMDGRERWRRLLETHLPLGLGLAAPLLIYALPYLATSGLDELVRGVLAVDGHYFAYQSLPQPHTLVWAIPFAALLLGGFRRSWSLAASRLPILVGSGALLAAVGWYGHEQSVYSAVWASVRPTVPVVTLAGVAMLSRKSDAGPAPTRRLQVFLLLALASMMSLIQVPFPAGIYFCYAAPLVVLATLGVSACQAFSPRRLLALLLGFYVLFAAVWLHRGRTYDLGFTYQRVPLDARLEVPRGGLRVQAADALVYQELVAEVQRRSAPDSAIFATPDSPEVYFLSARRNPTPYFFEVNHPEFRRDPIAHEASILALLERRAVDVVVLRHFTEFTPPLRAEFVSELHRRYPRERVLPGFTVRWREMGAR